MGKLFWSLLLVLALAYVCLVILLFFFQDRLAYYPQMSRELRLDPRDYGLDHTTLELTTADGARLDAWFVPAPESTAVALILHGNAGNMTHRLDTIAMFHRLGYGVLIFDYRGYGRSSGRPSEDGLYRDATAAWQHLGQKRVGDVGAPAIAPRKVRLGEPQHDHRIELEPLGRVDGHHLHSHTFGTGVHVGERVHHLVGNVAELVVAYCRTCTS